MDKPRISIIMKSRNRPHLLPRAVESLLAQSIDNWELIIVDDYSPSIDLHEYLISIQNDPHIRIIKRDHPTYRNVSLLWNTALDCMNGDYFAILDDDNTKSPTFCEAMVAYLDKHTEYDAVSCLGDYIDEQDTIIGPFDLPLLCSKDTIMHRNFIDSGCLAIRKEMLQRIGWFDEKLRTAEDWDYIIRLMFQSQGIGLIEDRLAQYRVHSGNSGRQSIQLGGLRDYHYIQEEKDYSSPTKISLNCKLPEIDFRTIEIEGNFILPVLNEPDIINSDMGTLSLVCNNKFSQSNYDDYYLVSDPSHIAPEIISAGRLIICPSFPDLNLKQMIAILNIIRSPRYFAYCDGEGNVKDYYYKDPISFAATCRV